MERSSCERTPDSTECCTDVKAMVDVQDLNEAAADISVIIPSYNEGDNVARTISYVRDELPSCDIIVVDDSSESLSPEQLGVNVDSSIKIIHRLSRGGQNTAYNLATASVKRKWALLIEADLLIPKGTLTRLFAKYHDSNFDLINCPNYPLEPIHMLSHARANYTITMAWRRLRMKKGIMPSRVILLKSSCIHLVFPVPPDFIDPTYWINAKALESGLNVQTDWDEKVLLIPPQKISEILAELRRSQFSSSQIAKQFPVQRDLLGSTKSDIITALAAEFLTSPKAVTSFPLLVDIFLRLVRFPSYSYGTNWRVSQSTKFPREMSAESKRP